MNIVVQKFGGTSVATREARVQVLRRIAQAKNDGLSPVVVVSAIGRKGDAYATDTLLQFIAEAGPDVPEREKDLLLSCGEIISCCLMTALLCQSGLKARAFTGAQAGILTDTRFGEARILEVSPGPLMDTLTRGLMPVVAGFQGRTADGDITTLGRGGSDTTAAALAAALKAQTIEIFTDVQGIMTADPALVGGARMLDTVTYEEVAQLAYQGAKVVHPRALELAMQYNIPLRVRSTFSDDPGTLVSSGTSGGDGMDAHADRLITGIAHLGGLAQVKIKVPEEDKQRETLLFESLAANGISIDIINVFPDIKIFAIAEKDLPAATRVLDGEGFAAEIVAGLAKVSIVGIGMRGVPGIMAQVVRVLNDSAIEILQTSDSHATISCLVRAEHTVEAVRALHEGFGLGK